MSGQKSQASGRKTWISGIVLLQQSNLRIAKFRTQERTLLGLFYFVMHFP